MGCWEFLLQQEGENSWIDIPTTVMAIPEGNYKMLGKGDRPNASIEIRLSHQNPDDPQFARSRKRLRQTNAEGLVVVLPSTSLTPGVWRIACYDSQTSNFLGSLELNVLSTEETEQIAQDISNSQFQLTLTHHTFIRSAADNLTVSGTIESDLDLERVVPLTLNYELRDPQTAEILYRFEQKLFPQKFPFTFNSHLQLGKESASYLILGEVILSYGTNNLARQPFSITANANQLLEAVRLPEFSQLLSNGKPKTPPTLLKVKPCKPIQEFPLSSGQVLPPKIVRTSNLKYPKLPALPPIELPETSVSQAPEKPSPEATDVAQPVPIESDSQKQSAGQKSHQDNSTEQSLDLLKTESRFWSHINALVADSK
jgi:hypothetical protein